MGGRKEARLSGGVVFFGEGEGGAVKYPVHYLKMPGIEVLCGARFVPHEFLTRDRAVVTCPACQQVWADETADALEDSALSPEARMVKYAMLNCELPAGVMDVQFQGVKQEGDKMIATLGLSLNQPVYTVSFDLVRPEDDEED